MSESSPTSRERRRKGKRADRHRSVAAKEGEGKVDEGEVEVEGRGREGETGEDDTRNDGGCPTVGSVVEAEEERQKEAHNKESVVEPHTSTLQHAHADHSIDEQLEAAASRKNLSVTNVKSILHHLIKDQRVLRLVQRIAAREEGGGGEGGGGAMTQQSSDDWDELTAYEPRLTRSRVRQAVMSAVASGSLTAEKMALLKSSTPTKSEPREQHFPLTASPVDEGDSSDEEYNPTLSSDEEEEEEDGGEEEEGEEEVGEEEEEEEEKEEGEEEEDEEEEERMAVEGGVREEEGEVVEEEAEEGEEEEGGERSLGEGEKEDDMEAHVHVHADSAPPSIADNTVKEGTSREEVPELDHHPELHTVPPSTNSSTAQPPSTCSSSVTDITTTLVPSPLNSSSSVASFPPPPSFTASSSVSSLCTALTTPLPTETASNPATSVSYTTSSAPPTSSLQELELQEAASLLASFAELHTLSPLKLMSQHPVQREELRVSSVGGINCITDDSVVNSVSGISGVSTVSAVNPAGIEGISRMDQRPTTSIAALQVPTDGGDGAEGEIAQRTRSKRPLHDVSITSLEAALAAVEGEDPPTPRELDPDELWWHQWLSGLTCETLNDSQVSRTAEDEEEEDGEYNFLADSLHEEEKEEFRNDRAVRIPRKEVDDLVSELLHPTVEGSGSPLLSSEGLDLTGAYLLETLGLQLPVLTQTTASIVDDGSAATVTSTREEVGCYLSQEQTVQLWTQLQQHFQLILQTFVLARFEPSLVFVSQVASQALDEIAQLCSSTSESAGGSVWHIPDLEEGMELVKKLDPYDENAVKLTPSAGNPPKVPEGAQHVLMNTALFWNHPQYLPAIGFAPLTANAASGTKYFTPEEECLLVVGMEHYGANAWQKIQQNVIPTKTLKQLKLRVKNQCSKRSGSNVIKEYKQTKKIPQKKDSDKPPELPQWIMNYSKKLAVREKEEAHKKQKIEAVRKILSSVSGGSTADPMLAPKDDGTSTQQTATDASSAHSATSAQPAERGSGAAVLVGSKRNLSDSMNRARDLTKKPRLFSQKGGRAHKGESQNRSIASDSSEDRGEVKRKFESRASMEHLLLAAGVEASDPVARSSYNYLLEVKNTVSHTDPSIYGKFLTLLLDYSQEKWRPSELYRKVSALLHSWPHLVSLFTDFLEPQDCLEANALVEKYELQSVKTFVSKLQSKYSSVPLHLEEIATKLRQLDKPTITRQEVHDSLVPLIKAHEELTEDLRRFVYHLAPPPSADDIYEELTVGDDYNTADDFEQVTLLDPPTNRNTGPSQERGHTSMPLQTHLAF